jgi:hypothetical protein
MEEQVVCNEDLQYRFSSSLFDGTASNLQSATLTSIRKGRDCIFASKRQP